MVTSFPFPSFWRKAFVILRYMSGNHSLGQAVEEMDSTLPISLAWCPSLPELKTQYQTAALACKSVHPNVPSTSNEGSSVHKYLWSAQQI